VGIHPEAVRFKVFGGIENLDQLDWTNLRFRESVSGGNMARETGIEPATARLGKPAFYFRDFCYFSGRKGLTPNPINLSKLAIPDHVATGGCGKSATVTSGAVF